MAWIGGGPITLATIAGLLAVLAVAGRQSIMLVNRYRALLASGDVPFGPDLVDRGTREQVAPTVFTAIAVAAVLVAFLVFGDVAGAEVSAGMAGVLLGGLVAATVSNLFLLPALYLRFAPREEHEPFGSGVDLDDAPREHAAVASSAEEEAR